MTGTSFPGKLIGRSFPGGGIYMDFLSHWAATKAGQPSPYNGDWFRREGSRGAFLKEVIDGWDRSQVKSALDRVRDDEAARQAARKYDSALHYYTYADELATDAQSAEVWRLIDEAAADLEVEPPTDVHFIRELQDGIDIQARLDAGDDLIVQDEAIGGGHRHGEIVIDIQAEGWALHNIVHHEMHHFVFPDAGEAPAYAYANAATDRAEAATPKVTTYATSAPPVKNPSSRWLFDTR